MDADYYLETISTVFQEFKLVKGTWDVKSADGHLERVKPADIKTTALLTVEGELDDISGSGQTKAAQDLCSGLKKSDMRHLEVIGAGHYGIFSGRRWREVVYPEVRAFIVQHEPAHKVATRASAKARVKPSVTSVKATSKPIAKAVAKASTKSAPLTKVSASRKRSKA
jgi:poly(3-hydroxybutyrate) depolymerase